MRTKLKFVLMSAAALLSLGLSSCSSKDDVEPTNPNYNAETGEVTTSFVFNVSATNTPTTRMTSANTQATAGTDAFRGIADASLLSFTKGAPVADGKWIPSSTTEANKQYGLGSIMSTSDATTDGTKSHRVIELALPLETNTLMFYGKAPKSGENADNAQGKITYTADGKNLTSYQFALNRRIATSDEATFQQYTSLIAAALNYICDAQITGASIQYGGSSFNVASLKWTQFVTISDAGIIKPATKAPLDGTDMCALGEIIGDALATLATVNTDEVRAGSGPSVERTMGDLLYVLNKVHAATPTSTYEAAAKALCDEIITRINNCFEGTAPTLTWKTANQVKDAISYSGAIDKITRIHDTGSALSEFPDEKFGVPKGCAQLLVTTTKSTDTNGQVTTPGTITWSYSSTTPLLSTGSTSIYNVYYPAELCYFGNSPIRVTDDAHVEADYPQGTTAWETDAQWAAGTNNNTHTWAAGGHVVSTTRSVAMQYNINYGSALLKTTVGYKSGISQLQDNNHAIQKAKNPSLPDSEEPNATIVITADAFRINGFIIGGQPVTVGWDFIPVSGETFDHNVYDKALPSGGDAIPASGTSTANYTLLWDNWNSAQQGKKQNAVYVAVEFINNSGKDFWGNKNIIRNGGTFYIIGKLDPNAGFTIVDAANPTAAELAQGITWPTKQALPPYAADGSTVKERRVFIQDFMTTATFKIGANSLQNAFVTVPDLRSSQTSLGLSVDLKWQTGLNFETVLGQ